MIKRKISKLVDPKDFAIYELEKFIGFIHGLIPDLRHDEAAILAALALANLPELFKDNPELVERLKDVATNIKLKTRSHNTQNN